MRNVKVSPGACPMVPVTRPFPVLVTGTGVFCLVPVTGSRYGKPVPVTAITRSSDPSITRQGMQIAVLRYRLRGKADSVSAGIATLIGAVYAASCSPLHSNLSRQPRPHCFCYRTQCCGKVGFMCNQAINKNTAVVAANLVSRTPLFRCIP